ncbi:carboxypeptidase-like regulatory domain-containing protein [Mucilaginibacter antarcticus]|uniref:carboxypeptidase-like regulatory domain-containing protein n=1 Tax=Mucilaginibacter antarcticus TaxID=1855725 RepID=UPI00363DFC49
MNKLMPAIIAVMCSTATYAQLVTGTVIDAKTNQALPFVNVGIVGKNSGTVTNDGGAFSLTLDRFHADSLRVSMLGYRPRSFLVADVVRNPNLLTIALIPDVLSLKEVKITSHKQTGVVLGNTTTSQSLSAGFQEHLLGHEIGAVIKIKKSPARLKRFNASIVNKMQNDSVKLRFNVYNVKAGMPDKTFYPQTFSSPCLKAIKQLLLILNLTRLWLEAIFL